eukprot:14158385-Alexandrium_andersonii.AAC.1
MPHSCRDGRHSHLGKSISRILLRSFLVSCQLRPAPLRASSGCHCGPPLRPSLARPRIPGPARRRRQSAPPLLYGQAAR